MKSSNESWSVECIIQFGMLFGMCRCVYGLVMETCHHFNNSKAPDFAFKSFSCMFKIGHECYGNIIVEASV